MVTFFTFSNSKTCLFWWLTVLFVCWDKLFAFLLITTWSIFAWIVSPLGNFEGLNVSCQWWIIHVHPSFGDREISKMLMNSFSFLSTVLQAEHGLADECIFYRLLIQCVQLSKNALLTRKHHSFWKRNSRSNRKKH